MGGLPVKFHRSQIVLISSKCSLSATIFQDVTVRALYLLHKVSAELSTIHSSNSQCVYDGSYKHSTSTMSLVSHFGSHCPALITPLLVYESTVFHPRLPS